MTQPTIWDEAQLAYRNGQSKESNPYRGPTYGNLWAEAWEVAKRLDDQEKMKLQSLVISKIDNLFEGGQSKGTYLECRMEDDDPATFLKHPKLIFIAGSWFTKSGWNSDRKIVHYNRVV